MGAHMYIRSFLFLDFMRSRPPARVLRKRWLADGCRVLGVAGGVARGGGKDGYGESD